MENERWLWFVSDNNGMFVIGIKIEGEGENTKLILVKDDKPGSDKELLELTLRCIEEESKDREN